jgi:flagellar M-ring protein FliF
VQAIVHLVASSVEGLEADEVTVADSQGTMLSAPGEDGMAAAAGDARAAQTQTFEDQLATDLEAMITEVTGPNRARVTVSAQLDSDQRQTTTESFSDPGAAPVVDETTNTETFTGSGAAVGGVLGPDAVPTTGGDSGGDSSYSRESTQRSFANDKTTETIQHAPGAVQRLSIAVLVDESAAVDQQAIEQLVRAGAGIDAARGDTVEVTQLPFDTSAAEAAQTELQAQRTTEERTQLFSLLRTVASIAIVGIVVLVAWRSTRKATATRYPLALELGVADPDERGLPVASRNGADADDPIALEAAGLAGPTPADLQREEMQDQITDLIDRQPDDVAQLLRGWMSERR